MNGYVISECYTAIICAPICLRIVRMSFGSARTFAIPLLLFLGERQSVLPAKSVRGVAHQIITRLAIMISLARKSRGVESKVIVNMPLRVSA